MDGKEICKYKFIPPKTDLKKVSITTSLTKKAVNKYPKNTTITLSYDNNPNSKQKLIGKGGNGTVWLVTWDKESIVFKYPTTEIHFEINAIESILGGYHHSIIPHRVIRDQHGNPFVIMQEANGDVFSLLNYDLSKHFRNKMIFHYTEAIGNLWHHGGIVFTDMKAENLLYQCHKDGMSLYFGDVGAFSKRGMGEYDYEVEPPESTGYIDKNFCLFTIGLLIISIYDFKFQRPKNTISSYEDKFYTPLREQINTHIGNKTIKSMAKKLLCWDSTWRDKFTVKEAVEKIVSG